MFYIYHSNELNILKDILSSFMKKFPIENPMCNEIIVTTHKSIIKWLSIKLAYNMDIVLNINIILINNFIWDILKFTIKNLPHNYFSFKKMIMWYIMRIILDDKIFSKNMDFHRLLQIKKTHKIFHFANKLSDLYLKYLIFRPDWIDLWENNILVKSLGKEEIWQSQIWKKLIKKIKKEKNICISNIYQTCLKSITKNFTPPKNYPKRIFLFDISFVPPIYIKILERLSLHIETHIFFMNPSCMYWSDIKNQSFFSHNTKSHKILFKNSEKKIFIQHSLLLSFGKSGANFLFLLDKIKQSIEIEAFCKIKNNTLLNCLKKDILQYRLYPTVKFSNVNTNDINYLNVKDDSIEIRECSSIYNEIELLYIYLLNIFENNHHIFPRDVIVMSTDIEVYAQAIQSIFNDSSNNIHAIISDRKILNLNPIICSTFNLLKLPKYKFSIEEVFNFLDCPAILKRYKISINEFYMLKSLIQYTEVHWGLNSKIFKKNHPNCMSRHTWTDNIKKILYQYAMDEIDSKYEIFLKKNYNKTNIFNIIGKLSNFIEELTIWYEKLSYARILCEWKNCINEIISSFFKLNKNEENILKILKQHWRKTISYGKHAKYKAPIKMEVLLKILFDNLEKEKYSQKFLSGKINFCNLSALKILPFKVICLLGMNEDIYPRSNKNIDFDLMYQSSRFGDQNSYDEDRYGFLKILLSTKNNLYISFIANSIQTENLKFPSVIINELLEYIAIRFQYPNKNKNNLIENFRLIKNFLIKKNSTESSLKCILHINHKNKNFLKINTDNKQPRISNLENIKINIRNKIVCNQISVKNILEFYAHPIRFWCKNYLNISFSNNFSYNNQIFNFQLLKYHVNTNLFIYFNQNYGNLSLSDFVYKINNLPYGKFAAIIAETQYSKISKLVNTLKKYINKKHNKIKIYFKCNNIDIIGYLPNNSTSGLLRWKLNKLSLYDGLLFWIEHLIYCISGGFGNSYLFGIESNWNFSYIYPEQAIDLFYIFLKGYQNGIHYPLFLLNKSGTAWIKSCFNKNKNTLNMDEKSQNDARTKLVNAWKGNLFFPGESKDLYLRKAIPYLTEFYIDLIIKEAKKYLIFPLKFNCFKKN